MPKGVYIRTKPSWNKGKVGLQVGWNRGLTKETDERVRKNGEQIRKTKKGVEKYQLIAKKAREISSKLPRTSKQIENARKMGKMSKTPEHIEILRENGRRTGKANWRGGLSTLPYPIKFGKKLKLYIKGRDKFICQNCNKTEEEEILWIKKGLAVHHIDYVKNNCDERNLITLCLRCNNLANGDRDYWYAFYTFIIGVIYDIAV